MILCFTKLASDFTIKTSLALTCTTLTLERPLLHSLTMTIILPSTVQHAPVLQSDFSDTEKGRAMFLRQKCYSGSNK